MSKAVTGHIDHIKESGDIVKIELLRQPWFIRGPYDRRLRQAVQQTRLARIRSS